MLKHISYGKSISPRMLEVATIRSTGKWLKVVEASMVIGERFLVWYGYPMTNDHLPNSPPKPTTNDLL